MTYNMIQSMNGFIKVENESFVYENKEYTGAKFIIIFRVERRIDEIKWWDSWEVSSKNNSLY